MKKSSILGLILVAVLLTSLLVCLALPSIAAEDAPTTGKAGENITWTYDSAKKTLTFEGTGDMYDFKLSDFAEDSATCPDWYKHYAGTISNVIVGDGITSVGDYALNDCTKVINLTLGKDVKEIGIGAFRNCTNLNKINLSEENTTFEIRTEALVDKATNTLWIATTKTKFPTTKDITNGTKEEITNIDAIASYAFAGRNISGEMRVPASVKTIADYAFDGCKITSLITNVGVTSVGKYAFAGCTNLKTISLDNVKTIGDRAFADCTKLQTAIIPEKVETVGNALFEGCKALASLSAPFIGSTADDSKTIGFFFGADTYEDHAAMVPEGLTKVTLVSETIKAIDDYTFYGCVNLEEVVYISEIESIGKYAFNGCAVLENIVIGESVKSIGDHALENCSALRSFEFGSKLETIGDYAFSGGSQLRAVTLPETLKSIGNYAFAECPLHTSVTIHENVKTIGDYAFYNNYSLATLKILNGVEVIGKHAFDGAKSITEIKIPDSVTTIEEYAFLGCSGVESLTIGNGLKTVGESALTGFASLKTIDVSNENSNFTCIENCLIDKKTDGKYAIILGSGSVTKLPENASVVEIAPRAFYSCVGITDVTIPANIKTIGDNAFYSCPNLKKVVIGKDTDTIGNGIFGNCPALEEISVDSANENYLSSGNCIIDKATKTIIAGCKTSVIPTDDTVTGIGDYAFMECANLMEIVVPGNIKTISGTAFAGCNDIRSIVLPFIGASSTDTTNNFIGYIFGAKTNQENDRCLPNALVEVTVTPADEYKIAEGAFYGCTILTDITLSDKITEIGLGAFYGCDGLINLTVPFVGGSESDNAFIGYIFGADKPESLNRPVADDGEEETTTSANGEDEAPAATPYIPTTLKKVAVTSADTILANAFAGCASIKEVEISDSVKNIAQGALSGCTALEKVTLPYIGGSTTQNRFLGYIFGAKTHSDNAKTVPATLATVIITNDTEVVDNAFSGCKDIKTVTLPDSVKKIGNKAFTGCTSLRNLTTPFIGGGSDSNKFFAYIFGAKDYKDNSVVPTTLENVIITKETAIPDNAFYYCTSIYELSIAGDVKSVGNSAFINCGNLETIVLPTTITSIGNNAFLFCHNLREMVLPEGVTSIGNDAFKGCSKLTRVVIPNSVESIGARAFEKCVSLTNVTFGTGVKTIGESIFNGCAALTLTKYENACYLGTDENPYMILVKADGYDIESCTISDKTVFIYEYAFMGCTKLTEITIPDSVKYVGEGVFEHCPLLTTINAPEGLDVKGPTDTTDGTLVASGCKNSIGGGIAVIALCSMLALAVVFTKKRSRA